MSAVLSNNREHRLTSNMTGTDMHGFIANWACNEQKGDEKKGWEYTYLHNVRRCNECVMADKGTVTFGAMPFVTIVLICLSFSILSVFFLNLILYLVIPSISWPNFTPSSCSPPSPPYLLSSVRPALFSSELSSRSSRLMCVPLFLLFSFLISLTYHLIFLLRTSSPPMSSSAITLFLFSPVLLLL